ncbi:MAG: hypothetical protein ACI9WO_001336 [Sphingobacteriales bacterium]|jgi:hypothetical protein
MKKYLILLALPFCASMVNGQDATQSKYAATITAADLSKHLNIIASDEYAGRETGKEGYNMAADYLVKEFKSYGIKGIPAIDGYFQKVPLIKSVWNHKKIYINQKENKFGEDFYALPGTELDVTTNDIAFVGYGIYSENYNDFEEIDVKDKLVLMFNGEPKNAKGKYAVTMSEEPSSFGRSYRAKLDSIKAWGATGLLVIDEDIEKNTKRFGPYLNHDRISWPDSETPFPVVYISPEMANKMVIFNKSALTKLKENIGEDSKDLYLFDLKNKINKRLKPNSFYVNMTVKIDITQYQNEIDTKNVLGFIEGTDLKDEVIVISAHLDHIGSEDGEVFNGADDDGSGSVGLIELAQAFMTAKKDGKGPRRSILILAVTGEEKGLLGSSYYASNPVFPLSNTIADLNIDMIGRVDDAHKDNSNYIYVIGSDKLSTELHDINEKANELYTKLDLDYTYNDPKDKNRYYYRSDHYNFAKNNIPIIFYFNGVHDDYHKASDTVDKINFEALQNRTRLVFHTAWQLANQDKRIEVNVENDFKN